MAIAKLSPLYLSVVAALSLPLWGCSGSSSPQRVQVQDQPKLAAKVVSQMSVEEKLIFAHGAGL